MDFLDIDLLQVNISAMSLCHTNYDNTYDLWRHEDKLYEMVTIVSRYRNVHPADTSKERMIITDLNNRSKGSQSWLNAVSIIRLKYHDE
jgi:hypothetical protein